MSALIPGFTTAGLQGANLAFPGVNAIGLGLIDALVQLPRTWQLVNTDTTDVLVGDYEPTEVTRTIRSAWTTKNSLGATKPISQFLHGEADTLSFGARLFQSNIFADITDKFKKLNQWVNVDPRLGRPPIVLFSVGNGDDAYFGGQLAYIESIADIKYDQPTIIGSVRGITFTVNLKEYTPFSLENIPPPETRYARSKEGDYMELLAVQEYGNPMMGEIIRRRHPALNEPMIATDTIVKLPSVEAISGIPIAPVSVILATFNGSVETPQRKAFNFHLNRLNRAFKSVKIPAGI